MGGENVYFWFYLRSHVDCFVIIFYCFILFYHKRFLELLLLLVLHKFLFFLLLFNLFVLLVDLGDGCKLLSGLFIFDLVFSQLFHDCLHLFFVFF